VVSTDEIQALVDSHCNRMRQRAGWGVALFALLLAASLLIIVGEPIKNHTAFRWSSFGWLAIPGVLFAVYLRRYLQHSRPESAPIARLLRERCGDILWVYPTESRARYSGAEIARFHFIVLRTRQKETRMLAIREEETQRAMDLLIGLAPHVLRGFTDANRKVFEERAGAR
jgi:hypothetical protein